MAKDSFTESIAGLPEQIREASLIAGNALSNSSLRLQKPSNILICGIGGSGLPAEITKNIVQEIPIIPVKDYELPKYDLKQALIFVISYSGNTEETCSVYDEALKKDAQIVVITSGGKLWQKAVQDSRNYDNIVLIKIPSELQPRMAYGYQTIPVLEALKQFQNIPEYDLENTYRTLQEYKEIFQEQAQKIASLSMGKIPLIYASERLCSAAYKWKINFNENAKIHAFTNVFPECNHNEISGFESSNNNYAVLLIRDKDDHPRIKKRMGIFSGILKKRGIDAISMETIEADLTTRLFAAIWLGDWASYYSASLRKVDPESVELIESFKEEMKK